MDIKSAKYFREKYMTDVRYVKPNSGCNPDYMGTIHKEQDGTIIKGFFDLYHGDKGNIEGFLSGNLKIAEDGQAIYEFMQNAADCDSTAFYMFYNDDYFLAVNNGKAFTEAGMRSILNARISQDWYGEFRGSGMVYRNPLSPYHLLSRPCVLSCCRAGSPRSPREWRGQ